MRWPACSIGPDAIPLPPFCASTMMPPPRLVCTGAGSKANTSPPTTGVGPVVVSSAPRMRPRACTLLCGCRRRVSACTLARRSISPLSRTESADAATRPMTERFACRRPSVQDASGNVWTRTDVSSLRRTLSAGASAVRRLLMRQWFRNLFSFISSMLASSSRNCSGKLARYLATAPYFTALWETRTVVLLPCLLSREPCVLCSV